MGDTSKLTVLVNEAKAMGIDVLPPDINESQVQFAPARDGTVIRYGLAAIKGVGEAAVEAMLAAREDTGPFSSLPDLCNRVDLRAVNRKVLEALIKAGACDSFGQSRASLTAQIDRSLTRASSAADDRARGQETLFGMLEADDPEEEETPAGLRNLPEWPDAEKLAYEKELLGFYVSGHPLEPFLSLIDSYCTHQVGELKELPGRTIVRVAGLVSEVRRGISRKTDKPYCIATAEDMETDFGVLCVNENYDKFNHLFEVNKPLMFIGEVNNSEDVPKIFPQEIFPIDEAPKRFTNRCTSVSRLNPCNRTPWMACENWPRPILAPPRSCSAYVNPTGPPSLWRPMTISTSPPAAISKLPPTNALVLTPTTPRST